MAISQTTKDTHAYVLKEDRERPVPEQTSFLIRGLSTRTMLRLQSIADDYKEGRRALADVVWVTLRVGLAGWRNFPDAAGGETPFEAEQKRVKVEDVDVVGAPTEGTLNR